MQEILKLEGLVINVAFYPSHELSFLTQACCACWMRLGVRICLSVSISVGNQNLTVVNYRTWRYGFCHFPVLSSQLWPLPAMVLTDSCLSSGPVAPVGHHTQLIGPERVLAKTAANPANLPLQLLVWGAGLCLGSCPVSYWLTRCFGLPDNSSECCRCSVNRGTDGVWMCSANGSWSPQSWNPDWERPLEIISDDGSPSMVPELQ